MSGQPITVALIFGGRSAEHEISLLSAASIFKAMSNPRYRVIPVLITHDGAWYRRPSDFSAFDAGKKVAENERLLFSPDPSHKGFLRLSENGNVERMEVDVVFPVLHGTFGEDGTLQGLLDLANVPYVGCGVLASAVGMDKVMMKGAFRDSGLNVGPFFWFFRSEWEERSDTIIDKLKQSRFPVFVKPANLGSSVGITRVKDINGFRDAVDLAASYDRKILVEDGIEGRELEVSVLGNDKAEASFPGEVVSHADFYDYEEKYHDNTAELIVPAKLSQDKIEEARKFAVTAFRAVDGSGLARVDMFLTPNGTFIVNEINTLPGFTSISMYPKLWEVTGIGYADLIDRLINLALERHAEKQKMRTVRTKK